MSDTSNDKKGFAGFESLAATDIEVDEPVIVEAARPSTPNPAAAKQGKAYATFRRILDTVIAKIKWHFWWLLPTCLVLWAIIDDVVTKSHYAKPAQTHSTAAAAPQKDDWQAVSTSAAQPPANAQPADTALDVLPIPSNYNPHITHYVHSALYEDFSDKIEFGQKFTKADYNKYLAASKAGNLDANFMVGYLTKYGLGTKKDEKVGDLMLFMAAEKGHPDALRMESFDFTNENAKLAYIMRAALQDDSAAQAMAGYFYFNGKIVPQDYNRALFWFKKAAEQMNPNAEAAISMMYYSGYGMPKDEHKAFEWAMKSAVQFNELGCGMVGAIYHDGEVVPKDYGQAYYWLSCAKQDDETVKNLKASIEPNMTEQDYITAAELGSNPAMIKLAKDYYYGTGGVQRNASTARKYMQMLGHTDDPDLNALNQSILNDLTPQETAQADADAAAWFKGMAAKVFAPDRERKQIEANRIQMPYFAESQPTIGSYPTLSLTELRWCEYQRRRLDYVNEQFPENGKDNNAITKANAEHFNNTIVANINALVNDANSRCPIGRQYYEKDMAVVTAELKDAAYENRIALDAQKIMLEWDERFLFK